MSTAASSSGSIAISSPRRRRGLRSIESDSLGESNRRERAESAEIICPASAGLASWTRLRVLRARRGCLPSRESDSHHGDGVWAFNVLYFASAASISDDSERKTPYCCSVGA